MPLVHRAAQLKRAHYSNSGPLDSPADRNLLLFGLGARMRGGDIFKLPLLPTSPPMLLSMLSARYLCV